MRKMKYFIWGIATFLYVGNVYADNYPERSELTISQQRGKVSGTISDEYGSVAGAAVTVKGTTRGVVTDMDGNFALDVSRGETIVVSFLGYVTQEIVYNGESGISVTLIEDTQKLDEVVVTALGMKRSEKAIGYAMTELKAEELPRTAISPVSALQGKVAGVEISGSDGGMFGGTKILIRGSSTLGGNNQPIYVVDGVILDNNTSGTGSADWDGSSNDYGNELKNLNPDDFESVTVLKGAAATALYGSRGLNGAIVITTKGGGHSQGFGINVNQSFGIEHVYNTPSMQNIYGPGTWSGTVNYGETNSDGTYKRWDNLNQFKLNSDGRPTLIGASGTHFGPKYDGREIEAYDKTIRPYEAYKNNYKDMFRLGFTTNTNISVQGGNEKTTFYSSLSYRHQEGILDNNTFDRLSLLIKATHQISKRVDVGISFSMANSTPRNAIFNIGDYYTGTTYGRSYEPDYYKYKYKGSHGGMASNDYGDTYGSVPGKDVWWRIFENDYRQKETVIRPIVDINVKLLDWLTFTARGNMNYLYLRGETKELGTGYANEGGYYKLWQESKEQVTLAGVLSADKSLGDFTIGGFLSYEYFNNRVQHNSANTEGGLIVPGQYFLDNSKNTVKTVAEVRDTKRILSAIGAINLSWKNQLFLDITGRNDWASSLVYTNGTGNYSFFYPSVSGSWIISETLDLPQWISFGKIRASWAQVGNDTDAYKINEGYTLTNILQSGGYIYANGVPSKLYEANLKPERKNAYEFGLDWRFFNGRLGIDATYYKENTTDQIMEISVPYESGIKTQIINAGDIQNQGVEIALKTIPYQTKDWEVSLDFTYTKNKNKIIDLHPNVQSYLSFVGDVAYGNYRIGSVAMIGGTYGALLSDATPATTKDGQTILNWNNNSRIAYEKRSGEIKEIGKITPDFMGSTSLGIRYKGFTVRALLDLSYGGHIASYSTRYATAYGISETSLRWRDTEHGGTTWVSQYADSKDMTFHDGVIPEGIIEGGVSITTPDGSKYVVADGGESFKSLYERGIVEPVHASGYFRYRNDWGLGTVNSDWFHERKYIALREVSIGYTLPKSVSDKIGARSLSVAVTGRNLGYLYNSLPNNLNPESVRGNDGREFRERQFSPFTANYMFTIGIGF